MKYPHDLIKLIELKELENRNKFNKLIESDYFQEQIKKEIAYFDKLEKEDIEKSKLEKVLKSRTSVKGSSKTDITEFQNTPRGK